MKLFSIILASGAVALCLLVTLGSSEDGSVAPVSSARSQFKLPKLFDFERFKKMFKKHYSSGAEMLVRNKLFLGRATRAFLSSVSYMYRKASSYMKINEFSDWTQSEIAKMYKAKLRHPSRSETSPSSSTDEQPAVDLDDIEEELAQVRRRSDEPGFAELAEELNKSNGNARNKRQSTKRRPMSLDEIAGDSQPHVAPKRSKKAKTFPRSNNLNYEPPELDSQGVDLYALEADPISQDEMDKVTRNDGKGYLHSMLSWYLPSFFGPSVDDSKEAPQEVEEDVMYKDLRDTNCLFQVRKQGRCGSCFAFASMAFFEFSFCIQTGNLVAFSEQYMLDCGDRPAFGGCDGGHIHLAGNFIKKYGLELLANYPYLEKDSYCPYTLDRSKMGYLRVNVPTLYTSSEEMFESDLEKGPILVSIFAREGFTEYGGGVDTSCDPERNIGLHAMLIIGHGREDGEDFWLIRNSHGVSFGVEGNYKLSKKSKCIVEAYVLAALIDNQTFVDPNPNPHYDMTEVKKKYQVQMLVDLKEAAADAASAAVTPNSSNRETVDDE